MSPASTVPAKSKKGNQEIVEALKSEASKNKTFQTIALAWAVRERARYSVTVGGLILRLSREGFKVDRKDVEQALTFLAGQGLGKIETDKNGKVRALTELRFTLQSIGRAAIGNGKEIQKFKQQRRYKPLPEGAIEVHAYSPPKSVQHVPTETQKHQVYVAVVLNGKTVKYPLQMQMTSDEILQFIADINSEVSNAHQ